MDTYEKKYKEIVGKIKKAYLYAQTDSTKAVLEEIIPELAESEDEKVRKALLEMVHDTTGDELLVDYNVHKEEALAWLEKQGDKCLVNFDEAEKEKYDFVSGQFIECRKSFNEFKEDNSYWLEYIGDDNYIGRSDNILNQKFHITPRQLFTLFTWQHRPKEDCNVNDEANAPTGYGKYVDECLNEAAKHFFSDGEDAYSVADLFYAGVRCGKSWLEKQTEQKPADSYCQENCKGFQETGKCFADGECKAKRESEQKTKENKGIIEEIVSYLINYSNIVESKEDADRIEYLIDKIQDICPHQKQEWSEEDEQHIDSLLKRLDALCRNKFERTRFAISEDRDWLKSLRPQNRWKPSELQLGCLSDAIEYYNSFGYPAPKLKELLDDLKKL